MNVRTLIDAGERPTVDELADRNHEILNGGVPAAYRKWSKLRDLSARNISKFVALLPQVSGPHESSIVHKLRALSRRAELMLELFYAKPLPTYVHKLRRRVKKCRHTLGKLADYDALLAVVRRSLDEARDMEKPAWQSMEEYLVLQRRKKAPKYLHKIETLDFSSLAAQVARDLEANGAQMQAISSEGGLEAAALADVRIRHVLGHLWRQFDAFLEQSRQDPCEQNIHAVRISVKELRNILGVMDKLKFTGSSEHLMWLRTIQRAIGRWHDLEVLEHMMTGMLLRRKFLREHLELAVEIEQLLLRNREMKKSPEENFAEVTRHSPEYDRMKCWVEEMAAAHRVNSQPAGLTTGSVR